MLWIINLHCMAWWWWWWYLAWYDDDQDEGGDGVEPQEPPHPPLTRSWGHLGKLDLGQKPDVTIKQIGIQDSVWAFQTALISDVSSEKNLISAFQRVDDLTVTSMINLICLKRIFRRKLCSLILRINCFASNQLKLVNLPCFSLKFRNKTNPRRCEPETKLSLHCPLQCGSETWPILVAVIQL